MNDDPSAIHVLYFDVADVQEQDNRHSAGLQELRQLAAAVTEALRSADLLLLTEDRYRIVFFWMHK